MKNPTTHNAAQIGAPLIILLALLTALDAMAIDMYLPGMASIAEDLGVSAGSVQQTLAVFLAGLAIGQGIYGPLLDRYGRRIPLLAGVVVFVLGSVGAAMAPTLEWLLAARFVQAIGAAAGLVAPRAIVADLCDVNSSARIFSLLMQVMMIAPVLAPVMGSFVLAHGSWRIIFWVLAALAVVGLVWGMRSLPESLPKERRVALSAGGIARAYGRQMRRRVFMLYTLAGGFVMSALFTYISGAAFIFTEYFSLSPALFSYLFAANSVGLIVGGMLSNVLLSRGATAARVTYIGLGIHALAGGLLYVAALAGAAPLALYAGLLAIAIGSLGLIIGNLIALTMNTAGPQTGVASALMGTLHYLVAAVVGYIGSFAAQPAHAIPLALALCGIAAIGLCRLADTVTESGQVHGDFVQAR